MFTWGANPTLNTFTSQQPIIPAAGSNAHPMSTYLLGSKRTLTLGSKCQSIDLLESLYSLGELTWHKVRLDSGEKTRE